MLVSKVKSRNEQSQPILLEAKKWLKSKSHLARLVFDRLGFLMMRAGFLGRVDQLWGEDFTEEDAHKTTELLTNIAKLSEAFSGKSLLMYTTGQAHVIAEKQTPLRSATVIETAANKANVPWINLTGLLRKRSNRYELYYPKDGHWTPAGHRAVAEILFDQIINYGLLPPDRPSNSLLPTVETTPLPPEAPYSEIQARTPIKTRLLRNAYFAIPSSN
jgi:hypothetical protein